MIKTSVSRRPLGWLQSACASALVFVSPFSSAALVENLTIANPKALALGNAVTADPPGVDSIHYNPAGLARVTGREGLFKLTLAYFLIEAEFGDYTPAAKDFLDTWVPDGIEDPVVNSSSKTDTIMLKVPYVDGAQEWPLPAMVVPTGGAAWRPAGKNYTLGTAAFAPLAAGYLRDDDDPGRFMGREMALTRVTYFSPTIGFKLNDEWSVGAGIHFSYSGISALTDLRFNHPIFPVVNEVLEQIGQELDCAAGLFTFCDKQLAAFEPHIVLEVDVETPVSVTGVFGALWEPTPWFTWGFVYQTEGATRMKGSYRLSYSEDFSDLFGTIYTELAPIPQALGFPDGAPVDSGDATVSLPYPAHFSTGISVKVLPDWKVNIDAKWTDFDVWDGIKIEFDKPVQISAVAAVAAPQYATKSSITIPRHYESVWNLAFGVEHQYNDRLVLRAGWEPRTSSIPDERLDVLLPFGGGNLFSVGFGWDWRKDQHFDFAFGWMNVKQDIPAGSSKNANAIDPSPASVASLWYNPYSGMDIETEVNAFLFEGSYTWQF